LIFFILQQSRATAAAVETLASSREASKSRDARNVGNTSSRRELNCSREGTRQQQQSEAISGSPGKEQQQ
jgi:hypothetical protein